MAYRRKLYIFAIIKQNLFKMYMFGILGEAHAHDYFEVISFYIKFDAEFWLAKSCLCDDLTKQSFYGLLSFIE